MPAARSSVRRSVSTLEETCPHRCCRSRNVGTGASRSSHSTRSAQRRPSRSSSAMIGRPVRDPRTGRPGSGAPDIRPRSVVITRTIALVSEVCLLASRCMLRKSNLGGAPRIRPVEPPYDHDTAAALEQLGPPIALFRLLARRPDRAPALCGAEYEWGIHVARFAQKAGLTPAQVRSLTAGSADDACWTDTGDRAVLG